MESPQSRKNKKKKKKTQKHQRQNSNVSNASSGGEGGDLSSAATSPSTSSLSLTGAKPEEIQLDSIPETAEKVKKHIIIYWVFILLKLENHVPGGFEAENNKLLHTLLGEIRGITF